jgi:hypothetical protein
LFVVLTGCKDDSNPVTQSKSTYLDGYNVNLTEAKGTTYTGNYFPLNVGDVSNYSGEQTVTTTTVIPGYPQDGPTTQTTAIVGMVKVLPKRLIQLSSGKYLLYPVVDYTGASYTSASYDTSRFFMKDTAAVYIKAIKMADGSFYEVTNPMFIKSKLVVGDSWETAPQIDMTKLLASNTGIQSNLTMNARAKFFVVGGEIVSLTSGSRFLVRLEQASDISMSGPITESGTTFNIDMTGQFATVYHMIADTGIVHQNMTGNMNIKMTSGAESATITINYSKCDLELTYRYSGPSSNYLSASKSSMERSLSFNTKTEEKAWKISQIIIRVIIKELSL